MGYSSHVILTNSEMKKGGEVFKLKFIFSSHPTHSLRINGGEAPLSGASLW